MLQTTREYGLGFGLFYIWKDENSKRNGFSLEQFEGKIFRAGIFNLDEKPNTISFAKKYSSPEGNMIQAPIVFLGDREEKLDLFDGEWEARENGRIFKGSFYLAPSSIRRIDFKSKLADIYLARFEEKLRMHERDIQEQFPFIPGLFSTRKAYSQQK